jgi:hypothetical protein
MSRRVLDRNARVILALVVLAGAVGLFEGPLLRGEVLAHRDLPYHWANRQLLLRLAAAGPWPPAWNPLVAEGQPFVANPHLAALHPLAQLHHVLPFSAAANLQVWIPLAVLASGTAWLLAGLGCGRFPRAWGALVAAAGGVSLSAAGLLPVLWTFMTAPLALSFLLRFRERRRTADALGLAAAVALACAGGEPVTLASVLLLLAASPWLGPPRAPRAHGPLVPGVLTAVGLGLAMAAAVLLPAARLALDSSRSLGVPSDHLSAWSWHPLRLAELIVPPSPAFVPAAPWNNALYPAEGFPLFASCYLGAILVPALVVGAGHARRGWAAVGLGAILLALGHHLGVLPALARAIPVLGSVRFSEKWLPLAALAAIVVAAHGLDRVGSGDGERRGLFARLLSVQALVAAAAGALLPGLADSAPWARSLAASAVVPAAVAAAAAIATKRTRSPGVWLLALTVGDCAAAGRPLLTSMPAGAVARLPAELAGDDAPSAGLRLFNLACWQTGHRLRGALGCAPVTATAGVATALDDDGDLTQLVWTRRALDAFWSAANRDPHALPRLLARRGIDRVLRLRRDDDAGGELSLLPVADARAPISCADAVLAVPAQGPWGAVLLEAAAVRSGAVMVEEAAAARLPARPAPCLVSGVVRERERVTFDVEAAGPGPSLVALAQSWDRGWRAAVDGAAVPLERWDLSLAAVAVPAGRHHVELAYRDPWLVAGLRVSACALVLWAAALVGLAWRERLRTERESAG